MTVNDPASLSMQSEINITPLIDVLLVLLIIFMVIVPVASRGEPAAAPVAAMHPVPSPDSPVILEILKDSQGSAHFRINQDTVAAGDLSSRLAAIFATRAQRVLFIKGDDQLSFRQIAEAIDISHDAGIDRVGLITPKVLEGL